MNNTDTITSTLEKAGVIVQPHVGFFRGHVSIKPGDLGLDAQENDAKQLMQMGKKRLIAKKHFVEINKVESRIRALCPKYGFPFCNGMGHFVPNGNYVEFIEEFETLKGEFFAARDTFITGDNFQSMIDEANASWADLAPKLTGESDASQPKAAALIRHLRNAVPTQDKVYTSFVAELKVFSIGTPSEGDLAEMDDTGEYKEVVEARRRACQEANAYIQHSVSGFVEDCVKELRAGTAQLCTDMLASIESSETGVHQKTLNRLVNFIGQFRGMNFTNDTEMDAALNEVEQQFLSRSAGEYRKDPALQTSLQDGLKALRTKAADLASQPVSAVVTRFAAGGRRVVFGDPRKLSSNADDESADEAPEASEETETPEPTAPASGIFAI